MPSPRDADQDRSARARSTAGSGSSAGAGAASLGEGPDKSSPAVDAEKNASTTQTDETQGGTVGRSPSLLKRVIAKLKGKSPVGNRADPV